MKKLLLGVLLLIAGCGGVVRQEYVDMSKVACAPNGGLASIVISGSDWVYVTTYCANGAMFEGRVLQKMYESKKR